VLTRFLTGRSHLSVLRGKETLVVVHHFVKNPSDLISFIHRVPLCSLKNKQNCRRRRPRWVAAALSLSSGVDLRSLSSGVDLSKILENFKDACGPHHHGARLRCQRRRGRGNGASGAAGPPAELRRGPPAGATELRLLIRYVGRAD
jgi:hypothetical protein